MHKNKHIKNIKNAQYYTQERLYDKIIAVRVYLKMLIHHIKMLKQKQMCIKNKHSKNINNIQYHTLERLNDTNNYSKSITENYGTS